MSAVPRHSEEELRQQWAFLDALVDRQAASLKSGVQDPEEDDVSLPMVDSRIDLPRGDLHPDPAGHDTRGRAIGAPPPHRSRRGSAHCRGVGSLRGRERAPCRRASACPGAVASAVRRGSAARSAAQDSASACLPGHACLLAVEARTAWYPTRTGCGRGRSPQGARPQAAAQELVAADQGVTAPAGFGLLPCAIPTN